VELQVKASPWERVKQWNQRKLVRIQELLKVTTRDSPDQWPRATRLETRIENLPLQELRVPTRRIRR
jgi:hypothetical protein